MKNNDEIIRIDGKNCFIKALSRMLCKGKVILCFVRYDNDFKLESEIPFYMDIPDFLVLAEDVSQGELKSKIDIEREKAISEKRYPKPVWESRPAGTSKEDLIKRGKPRPDGKDEARMLQILPATKSATADVILQAVKGPGARQGKGGLLSQDFPMMIQQNVLWFQ